MALATALLLASCAYDPGLGQGPAYRSDLAACQKSAGKQADAIVKRRFYTFVTYPVSERIIDRREVRQCLEQKGYRAAVRSSSSSAREGAGQPLAGMGRSPAARREG